MRGPAVQPIVIAAGGTGGHFFPAEALATELLRRGRRIALITDARSGGLSSRVFEGSERFVIAGAGIAGRSAARAAQAGLGLALGTLQARRILGRLNPSVVVGFGGYPSLPPVLAARLLRRRPTIVLHEQNAVLGRANRLLARHADVLALSHAATTRVPETANTQLTGNPVRPSFVPRPYVVPAADGPLQLLVLGGSLGARVLSDVVPAALGALPAELRARLRLVQQCRREDLARVQAAYAAAGIAAELEAFFEDVPERLAAAQLVIARAGASTVAELAVVGRPAILVPLPGAIDDHQSANARALAGWTIAQSEFSPASLAPRIERLFDDPSALAAAAEAAAAQGRPDAAERLADVIEGRDLDQSGLGEAAPSGVEGQSPSRSS